MKRALCLLCLLGLAACGADGEPIQPSASISVGVGDTGTYTAGSVGISRGPLSIFWGFS